MILPSSITVFATLQHGCVAFQLTGVPFSETVPTPTVSPGGVKMRPPRQNTFLSANGFAPLTRDPSLSNSPRKRVAEADSYAMRLKAINLIAIANAPLEGILARGGGLTSGWTTRFVLLLLLGVGSLWVFAGCVCTEKGMRCRMTG